MREESRDLTIPAQHERWGDALGLVSIVVTLVVLVAVRLPMEEVGAGPSVRVRACILLATIGLAAIIGQAAGLAAARRQTAVQPRRID